MNKRIYYTFYSTFTWQEWFGAIHKRRL